VTLPLLMPTVIAAIVLRGIDCLKTFDILYATLGPGGGSVHEGETLNVYVYGLNFNYNEYGLAAAVLVLYFVFIALIVGTLLIRTRNVGR
jgi:multiple sugar transport system permease protein